MKQNITLFLLLLTLGVRAQTIFVKYNAAGLNDGSSWANAYPSLDQALAVAAEGQSIWVAAGTYKPATPAPNHSFPVVSGVNLYGGFAGTETSLSQRNIVANPTILSGDILGDDVAGNFTQNRSDNSTHVLVVFVNSNNNGSTIDGFTIKSGQTLTGAANSDLTRRGGGLLINAKAQVRNCKFTDNYGESGAAMAAIEALSDESTVENCLFESNVAIEDAICFLRSIPSGSIKKCIFRNNTTRRGSLYFSNATDMRVDSCLFDHNVSIGTATVTNFGGAMFCWQSTFTLTNTIFRNNRADRGAGMYIDGRDGGDLATIKNCLFEGDTTTSFGGSGIYAWQATMALKNCIFRNNVGPNAAGLYCDGRELDSSIEMDSCIFEGNTTNSYGGSALYNYRTNYTLRNCVFKNNMAPSSGAAIYNSDLTHFYVDNCLFEGNKANYAAAIANYGLDCKGGYVNCTFQNNKATQGGGAASNGFKSSPIYEQCAFVNNQASFGAAIFTQNDTTRLYVIGCYFENNNASGTGGAIYVNTNIAALIIASQFYQNKGATGGAIHANGDSLLLIDKCSFLENIAGTQGAAVNLNHVNAVFSNSILAKNVNSGAGAGGGISNNADNNRISKVKAVNCTFADNFAAIGAGIAQWEADTGTAELTLLNCLFQNPDAENYNIEEGNPEVFSLNGNQSSDQTLEPYLTANKDLHNTFNDFVNPDGNDYAPTVSSPAADGGVSAGAPVDDYLGIYRTGIPDVGYREVKVSSTQNPGLEVQPLQCAPNPAREQTTLSFTSERNGTVQITVWNQLGQPIGQYKADKTTPEFSYPLNVMALPAGAYKVQIRLGAIVHEGTLEKF